MATAPDLAAMTVYLPEDPGAETMYPLHVLEQPSCREVAVRLTAQVQVAARLLNQSLALNLLVLVLSGSHLGGTGGALDLSRLESLHTGWL